MPIPSTIVVLASLLLLLQAGCQGLAIPSYRGDLGSASYGGRANWSEAPSCDADERTGDSEGCGYTPTVPVPACMARWRERQELPEGPDGVRFHPLPTRPMFQPRPASSDNWPATIPGGQLDGSAAALGTLPEGQQWDQLDANGASKTSGTSNSANPDGDDQRAGMPDDSILEPLPAPAALP